MSRAGHVGFKLVASALVVTALAATAHAQGVQGSKEPPYPKPSKLPNPYRLVADWPALPATMKGPEGFA
jgi:hypothetical protein